MALYGNIVEQRSNSCCVCGSRVHEILTLPDLPLTDTYCREAKPDPIMGIDQTLFFCEECGQGQLGNVVSPRLLYEEKNYIFRTSASATARRGSEFFISLIESVSPRLHYRCILDVGCNDLYLLRRLSAAAARRVGIDPILRGHEAEAEREGIIALGKTLEEVVPDELPEKPDLIVCRHTLEHVVDPRGFIQQLMDISSENALFVFEVPGFDGLVTRLRFDQVFHQHLNYFSLRSFLRLLAEVGAAYVSHRFNYHDWGAMAVAFSRKDSRKAPGIPDTTKVTGQEISARYKVFQTEMESTRAVMSMHRHGSLYGYGAAQMLPVLAYHMKTDFKELTAVIDDDPQKDGIGYWNLPVRVVHSERVKDLQESTVLVTAFDNIKPILMKLLEGRPRHIIVPFNLI